MNIINKEINKKNKLLILLLSLALSACVSYQTELPGRFSEGINSQLNPKLYELPEPEQRINVSIYSFRDKTGQYKPASENQLSTAVTQGASSMLITALNSTSWFNVLEREGLQNILTERKLFSANKVNLPNLRTANLILEGGVIAYESNVRTGGEGAQYFGLGIHEQYRADMVVVSLRAINVSTGAVISTVTTQEKILSREIRSGLFRFVKEPKLLELEAGYTYSEPRTLCVNSAIEKAVLKLVAQGVEKKFWSTKLAEDTRLKLWSDLLI